MAITPFDLSSKLLTDLQTAHDPKRGFFSWKTFEAELFKFRNSLNSGAAKQSGKMVGGVITLTRTERFMYMLADTEGMIASDDLDTITGDGWTDWDMLFVEQANAGRVVRIKHDTGNIKTLNELDYELDAAAGRSVFTVLLYLDSTWYEFYRYPLAGSGQTAQVTASEAETVVIAAGAITISRSIVRVEGEYSGETLATAQFTIVSVGSTGDVMSCSVLEAPGQEHVLGSYAQQGGDTEADIAAGVAAAINALTGTHGYTAADVGDEVTVTAPVGTGASANTFSLALSPGGTIGAVLDFDFTGGVNGAPADDTLTTISGAVAGQMFTLINAMNGILTLNNSGNIIARSPVTLPKDEAIKCLENNNSIIVIRDWNDELFKFRGAWGSATQYYPGDVVSLNYGLYYALASNLNVSPDTTVGVTWQILTRWYNDVKVGIGAPDNSLGMQDDWFIEDLRATLWVRSSGAWSKSRRWNWDREIMAGSTASVGKLCQITETGTFSQSLDSTGTWASYKTAAGAGNAAGLVMNTWVRVDQGTTEAMVWFLFPEATTNLRLYIGLTSAGFGDTDTPAGEYLGIRFLSTAGDTKMTAIMKGTSSQVTSVGATPTISTPYLVYMQYKHDTGKGSIIVYAPSSMAQLSAHSMSGSALSAGSTLRTEAVVWSQAAGAGGQRTIGVQKMAGRGML